MSSKNRVGCVSHVDDDTLYLIGYGEYEGEFAPSEDDEPVGLVWEFLKCQGRDKIPRLRLDQGRSIWACECYWYPEEEVRELIKDFERVKYITVEERRKQVETGALTPKVLRYTGEMIRTAF